jgi:sortase A
MRRLIRDASFVLIISGALLLADAAVTLLWQEPLTAVVALIKRDDINRQFLSYTKTPLNQLDRRALASLASQQQRIAYLARQERSEIQIGDGVGLLQMPKLGASYTVVQGTNTATLEKGPGHYPQTAFPGVGQTVAIAGHRTTYLAPFRNINRLDRGDLITLTMRYAKFTYVVQYHQVVQPNAWWITKNLGYDRLVLSACNPIYSASQRIVVFAKLSSEEPLGPAVS